MASEKPKISKEQFKVKQISPSIGVINSTSNDGITAGTDLVEITFFLYVRVVSASDLLGLAGPNTCYPYVEMKVGPFKGRTMYCRSSNPVWNQVFVFEKARIQEPNFELGVKDEHFNHGNIMGRLSFAISEVPVRSPTESALAAQWYGLEDQKGNKRRGELLLAVWIGTQADDAFPEALHLEAASLDVYNIADTRAQIYFSPRLWIFRIFLVQAQELLVEDKIEKSEIFIQGTLGSVTFRSKLVNHNNGNPKWNEGFFNVVAEPLDQRLVLSVEQGTLKDHESLGTCTVPLRSVEKKLDGGAASSKWYALEIPKIIKLEHDTKFASKLSMRLSIDGGYHIFNENPECTSDLNPTAKKLWRPSIGVFEMGILNATGLPAMKKGNYTDAYCVAKYGPKWVRTRTVVNSLSPKWNEQYSWDVYDPCTFFTISVFDNGHIHRHGHVEAAVDAKIGKVRIYLAELTPNLIYTYSYPLIKLQYTGLKKMGEIQLAFRFCCQNKINLYLLYRLPMLPRLHFSNPLTPAQINALRKQAVTLISSMLSKNEPPLRREVVEHVLDYHEKIWSMRRGKADIDRIRTLLSYWFALSTCLDDICKWKNHISTLIICVVLIFVIWNPQIVLPSIFFCLILDVSLQYSKRPKHLSHWDLQLSHVHTASKDEIEEEFDPIPSIFRDQIIRNRYDQLRDIAKKSTALVGVAATEGEKLHSLLSWEDFIATTLFVAVCLITGIATFVFPFPFTIGLWLFYMLRHPRWRSAYPTAPVNFMRKIPSKLDRML